MRVKNVFEWCLKQGEKGDSHKGLRKISSNQELSQHHLIKAKHNLKAVDHNLEEFPDWSVNAAFYAKYHALLAILFKLGYESRNQECTINAVEYLIKDKIINFDQKYIEMIRRTSEMMPKDSKTLREEFQYGVKTEANKILLKELKNNAIQCVEAVELLLKTLVM